MYSLLCKTICPHCKTSLQKRIEIYGLAKVLSLLVREKDFCLYCERKTLGVEMKAFKVQANVCLFSVKKRFNLFT